VFRRDACVPGFVERFSPERLLGVCSRGREAAENGYGISEAAIIGGVHALDHQRCDPHQALALGTGLETLLNSDSISGMRTLHCDLPVAATDLVMI